MTVTLLTTHLNLIRVETGHHEEENRGINNLKMIRNERLPKEPCPSDPHYVVSIRHLSLGVLTRRFSLDDFVYSQSMIG